MSGTTVVTGPWDFGSGDSSMISEVVGGGEPPYDGGMEDRVKNLEEFVGEARTELRDIDVRLSKIETRLDATATKADIQESANATIKWVIATAAGLGIAGITVMTFVLNNAIPKAQAAPVPAAQAPIIIYAQPQPGPAPAAPAAPPPAEPK